MYILIADWIPVPLAHTGTAGEESEGQSAHGMEFGPCTMH